jgi:hypothetical protein
MNFLDIKATFNNELYKWYRGVSGIWHHWEKLVLNGEVTLHIEGSEVAGGYWGTIRMTADSYDRFEPMFSTRPNEGLHVPFRTPENCAQTLDNEWVQIIKDEGDKNGN